MMTLINFFFSYVRGDSGGGKCIQAEYCYHVKLGIVTILLALYMYST